jgi:hypothetical protein
MKSYLVLYGIFCRTSFDTGHNTYQRTITCEPSDLPTEVAETKTSLENRRPPEAEAWEITVTQIVPLS